MGSAIHSLFFGILNVAVKDWWIIAIIVGAKLGPRMVRGALLRRGGLR